MPHQRASTPIQRPLLLAAALLLGGCAPQAFEVAPRGAPPQLLVVRAEGGALTLLGRGFGEGGAVYAAATASDEGATQLAIVGWSAERVEAALPEGLHGGWLWLAHPGGVSVRFPWRRP